MKISISGNPTQTSILADLKNKEIHWLVFIWFPFPPGYLQAQVPVCANVHISFHGDVWTHLWLYPCIYIHLHARCVLCLSSVLLCSVLDIHCGTDGVEMVQ